MEFEWAKRKRASRSEFMWGLFSFFFLRGGEGGQPRSQWSSARDQT